MTHHIQGTPIRLTADFSPETMGLRRQWGDLFKVFKKICQPRILYLVKLFFKMERIRHSQISKNCEFVARRPALQKNIKDNPAG